jgi:hypothetical protein
VRIIEQFKLVINWALFRLAVRRDMEKGIQELFMSQSQVIATLALRISVLEKLLLDKKILTEEEISKETTLLGKEFAEKIQDSFRKASMKNV